MKLGEQFRSKVATAGPEDSIESVVGKMHVENVGAIVIVRNGKVAGIVTDRDVALKLGMRAATPDMPVSQIMTKKVETIWEDQGVFNATQYLMGHKVRRLPIIDRDDRLVGMVTFDDLFALLAQELKNLSQAVAPALAAKESD